MKDKKGFTLIELLITISIMALLLILVIPSIRSLQNTNKETGFEYYKDSLIEAAKVYITKEGEDINEFGYSNWKGCVDVTYNDLIDADLVKPYNDEDIDCSDSFVRYIKTNDGKGKYTYKVICKDENNEEVYNESTLENEEECEIVNLDDKTPPECGEAIGENTEWTRNDVTITMSCTDTESGCKSVTKTFDDTTKVGYIEIEDGNGNKNTCPVNVYIDKKGPNCTSSGGSNSWTRNAVTLTGICSDEESGCVSNVTKKYDSEGNFTNQSPGVVKDKLGNETTCPANQTIRIDRTPPAYTAVFPACGDPTGTNKRAYVELHFSDYGSGLGYRHVYDWDCGSTTVNFPDVNYGGITSAGDILATKCTWLGFSHTICDVVGNCNSWNDPRVNFNC